MPHTHVIIAITGGIGSGKSTVAHLFEGWGAKIVDADILAREVVKPGTSGLQSIISHFGEQLLLPDGSLNRPQLASIIFSDSAKKALLESIVHPLIRKRWLERLHELKKTDVAIIGYVVPLFFESSTRMTEIEKVVLVSAPEQLRIERIIARDGFPREIAELRVKAQLPDNEKIKKSDFVIVNDSSKEALIARSRDVFSQLQRHTGLGSS